MFGRPRRRSWREAEAARDPEPAPAAGGAPPARNPAARRVAWFGAPGIVTDGAQERFSVAPRE